MVLERLYKTCTRDQTAIPQEISSLQSAKDAGLHQGGCLNYSGKEGQDQEGAG